MLYGTIPTIVGLCECATWRLHAELEADVRPQVGSLFSTWVSRVTAWPHIWRNLPFFFSSVHKSVNILIVTSEAWMNKSFAKLVGDD